MPSAIATLAVNGPQPAEMVATALREPAIAQKLQVGQVRFLKWDIGGAAEHVVCCRVDNRTVEIHCHGGVAITDRILNQLRAAGCDVISAEVWSLRRASDTGNPAEIVAEQCRQALMQANGLKATGVLLDQRNGALFAALEQLAELLRSQRLADAREHLRQLTRWDRLGQRLTRPWQVVLAGPPNVGKSSLINAITGQSVSIVHHEAGTTRDWIEAVTVLDGWPFCLTDTAGLRDTDEEVEREGVARARQRIERADLVLIVVDRTIGWTPDHSAVVEHCRQSDMPPHLLILENKADLVSNPTVAEMDAVTDSIARVACSATGDVQPLIERIVTTLLPEMPPVGAAVVFDPAMQKLLAELSRRITTETAPLNQDEVQLWQNLLFYGESQQLTPPSFGS